MQQVRQILIGAIATFMAIWFGAGLVMWPDAPVHPCDDSRSYLHKDHPNGFCGKQGQSHTAADFHNYRIWETGMLILWPSGMLSIFLLRRKPA